MCVYAQYVMQRIGVYVTYVCMLCYVMNARMLCMHVRCVCMFRCMYVLCVCYVCTLR